MASSLRALLAEADAGDAPAVSMPRGLRWVEVAAIVAIASGSVIAVPRSARPAMMVLLVLAVLPFVVEAVGLRVSAAIRVVSVLAAVGAVSFSADRLDFSVRSGQDQLAQLIVVWLVARTLAFERLSWGVAAAAGAAVITVGRAFVDPAYQAVVTWTVAVGAAALAGLAGRLMTGALVELQRTQVELSQTAASTERHRIARDVHDVVAHSLTITMLDITAARMAVLRGDDSAALSALEEAEATGRRSLGDIRRVVRLLRSSEDDALQPVASASDIRQLVDDYRNSGMAVAADIAGDLATVAPAPGLVLYRITQESLANVARHASGSPVSVALRIGSRISLEVRNAGGPYPREAVGNGLGVLGMRERAAAVGGWCEAGPAEASPPGWVVRCELPSGPDWAGDDRAGG